MRERAQDKKEIHEIKKNQSVCVREREGEKQREKNRKKNAKDVVYYSLYLSDSIMRKRKLFKTFKTKKGIIYLFTVIEL